MDKKDSFSITGRVDSFRFAFRGIVNLISGQHNARIHVVAALLAVLAGLWFQVTRTEWCFLILAITGVFIAEAFNTAIEHLCDLVSPDYHPLVEKAKDVAAGAVLISAIGASSIGLIIFVL